MHDAEALAVSPPRLVEAAGSSESDTNAERLSRPVDRPTPELRLYTPEPQIRRPIALMRAMWKDLVGGRELAWRLFVRDVAGENRDSVLSYLWVALPPIGATAIWVFLHNRGVINADHTQLSYLLYVLAGTLLWETFVSTLSRTQDSLVRNAPLLLKSRPSYEALLLSSFAYSTLQCLIRMAILVVAALFFLQGLPWQAAFAPITLLVLMVYAQAVGMILAPVSAMFRDAPRIMAMLFGLWFMATPIVYTLPADSLQVAINPVAPLLLTCRDLMTLGETTVPGLFLIHSVTAAILFVVGWVVYRVSIPHVVARMGS